MDDLVREQTILLEKIKYYEAAYSSAIKLLKAVEGTSEAQVHLFSATKYYQDKILQLRKELEAL